MATTPATKKSVAERFNLTEAEAAWVEDQVDPDAKSASQDKQRVQAALSIRAQRVGPASLPEFRPLPADTRAELGLDEEEDVLVVDDEVTFLGEVGA